MGTGNDEIVLTAQKTNPITSSDESTRKRRDLTEQLEEESSGEEEKGVAGRAAKQGSITSEATAEEEGQFPDAEGVRVPTA